MNLPVYLSQNFIHKQNVRSYANILQTKILKAHEDGPFLCHIFEDKSLVSELPTHLNVILSNMKVNLRNKCKEEFGSYFSSILRPKNSLCIVNKEDVFRCCWVALNEIIPRNFFGGNYNAAIFKKLIHVVINSMKRQHILIGNYLEKWDFSVIPWTYLENAKTVLYKLIIWIIKFILSPMICLNFYVSTSKLDADENKLHYFWKSQWQSFYDKKIAKMIFCKVLKRCEFYYISKKVKQKFTLNERQRLKNLKREIPKLYLILKPNNNSRPIVRYKSEQVASDKYKVKDRLKFLKTLTPKHNNKIESDFNKVYQEWIKLEQPKLYIVKTDLSNAFGLINKEKLMKILCERHLSLQKAENNMYTKRKYAQQYKEIMNELRKPLLVRAGNTVYEWTEGLVQGYKYSPALSELYYSYLDDIYFSEHFKNSQSRIKYFTRVVDDYLYITDSLEDAHSFLDALTSYRNVNYDKTVVNFPHDHIKCVNEIIFLGYSYNVDRMEVSRASNVYVGQMCYKIAFSSCLANLNKFLENRIGQSGIQINGHIFNLHHNSEELIWNHIFTTFCLSANKFCTILAVCDISFQTSRTEMLKYLRLYKKRVSVKLSNSIIETLMRNKPTDFLFMYCINHFKYLSFKALYLCATQTYKCNGLVPFIKDELARSNCIFGKWKQHACRIESTGEIGRHAIREICTRIDLRRIMKGFDKLPDGFECYNRRKCDL